MDLDQIFPDIYVGSCPQTTDDVDRLKGQFAITAVLNLQTDEDFQRLAIDWPRLAEYYGRHGIEVRRVPVRDFDADDLRQNLVRCVKALEQLVEAGHRVYVHCTAGVGRSASTVVAYQHWIKRWDLEQAAIHLNRLRPCYPNLEVIRQATLDRFGKPPGGI